MEDVIMLQFDSLQTIPISDIKHLKVHGRTTEERSPLTLFWTASGIEMNVTGSELWIELESNYEQYEPWIHILVNDVSVSRFMLQKGKKWVPVFRGMNTERVKNIRIVKETQAMSDDSLHQLHVHQIALDGQVTGIADRPYKIEFIGDSITSGEGAIGARGEEDWIPMWFSAIDNYSYMTANQLNADYRVISQSGWGVMTSWDNNPNHNIPQYYEQVCGLMKGKKHEANGAHKAHDFSSWQPNAVVVNLGTNDGGSFYNASWNDPSTGRVYKQRLNEDGTFHKEDLASFEQAAYQFIVKLRALNPEAHIVWAYGMLGTPMMPAIRSVIESYKKATGDINIGFLQLPNMTDETVGARQHPGKLAHEQAAYVLVQYLKKTLNV